MNDDVLEDFEVEASAPSKWGTSINGVLSSCHYYHKIHGDIRRDPCLRDTMVWVWTSLASMNTIKK